MPDKGRIRALILLLLKGLLVAVIFTVIFVRTDTDAMFFRLVNVSVCPLLAALLLFWLNRILTAVKWSLLLKHNNINAEFKSLVRIMFESSFIGLAIPSGLGPDIIRLIQIRTHKHDLTLAAGSVLADRMMAILSLALLSGISAAICLQFIEDKTVVAAVLATAFALTAVIMGLMTPLSTRILKSDRTGNHETESGTGIPEKLRRIHNSFAGLLKCPAVFMLVLAVNIVVQLVRIAQAFLLFVALGNLIPVISVAAFYPMILLVKLLPFVPFMGLGVQEGAFAYFFHQVGVSPETAVSASLLNHLIVIAGLIPGAALFLSRKRKDDRK